MAWVKARIAAAARRAGRDPTQVTLVAVTKTFPAETIWQAYQLDLRDFGENRVEEAQTKLPGLRSRMSDGRFHMIGHLQSRKARDAVTLFDMLHSIDSLKLARKLNGLCQEIGKSLPVLLECNVSGEASKYGFQAIADDRGFLNDVETIVALPGLRVEGLMTMAPIVSEPEQARPVFEALRQLGERLAARFGAEHFKHLSMGMSDDFEVAVEEGATLVRIGRALFGERRE